MNARSFLLALAATLALAACGREAEVAAPPVDVADAAAPAAPAEAEAIPLSGDTYVFGFSTPPDVAEDPRIVDWAEDPCGETAMAAVTTMPIADAVLLPDFVVEFDESGTELRRWGKPYSAEIVAVSGERLHFRAPHAGATRVFWTQPDGSLGLLDDVLADPSAPSRDFFEGAIEIECPGLPVFSGSDYVQCHQITDDAGTRRLLAWEGACS